MKNIPASGEVSDEEILQTVRAYRKRRAPEITVVAESEKQKSRGVVDTNLLEPYGEPIQS
jgi:hypothetical protein